MLELLIVLGITKLKDRTYHLKCQQGTGGRVVDRILVGELNSIQIMSTFIANTFSSPDYLHPVVISDEIPIPELPKRKVLPPPRAERR